MATIVIPVTVISWAVDPSSGRGTIVLGGTDGPTAGGTAVARGMLLSIDAEAADIQALTLVEGQQETLTLSTS